MIDIGYKSEGRIPISEFLTPTGEITAQIGEWVDVLIEKRDDEKAISCFPRNVPLKF